MSNASNRTPVPRIHKLNLFHDLGYVPHPGQLAVHESKASRRVLACGVRWGKTKAAAMEGIAAALAPAERSIGWIVAPTYDLADRVFKEIEIAVLRSLRPYVVSLVESERRLVIRNLKGGLSEIRAKTADNPVSLLGEGLDWVIVDEAARLKPSIWNEHLSQRLLDKKGWALLISTPSGKGWFYEAFRRGQGRDPGYESWNCPSWSNPHLDKAQIEAERERLPERIFLQEYGAQFIEGAGSVFRYVRECATGELEPYSTNSERWYNGGLDLAKTEDFTVLVIGQERESGQDGKKRAHALFFDRFQRQDWAIQTGRVRAAADRFGKARLLVDSTGAGDPIFHDLRRAGCRVEPYLFTNASKNDLITNLALMLEQRSIVIPRPELWPELIEELEAFEYSITDSGNVRTSAPSGMHDDCVIALALFAWQVRPSRPQPRITIINFP